MSSNDLRQAQRDLARQLVSLEGCESLLGDFAKRVVVEAGKSIAKSVANKSIELATIGLKRVNTELIKSLGSRRMFISHLYNKVKKSDQVQFELLFNKTIMLNCTRDGEPDDLVPSVEAMIKNTDILVKYAMDLEVFYRKELQVLKDITNIKTTDDAVKIIGKLDNIELPDVKFTSHSNSMSQSEWLPGGYAYAFNSDNGLWRFAEDEDHSATEVEDSYRVSDVESLLKKLNILVSLYQPASKASATYVEYLKTFNTVVGKSFQHLDTLKGEVSTSLLNDLGDRLNGNQSVYSFYVGYLPKVMVRLDDYVDTLSSYLSKQFN